MQSVWHLVLAVMPDELLARFHGKSLQLAPLAGLFFFGRVAASRGLGRTAVEPCPVVAVCYWTGSSGRELMNAWAMMLRCVTRLLSALAP